VASFSWSLLERHGNAALSTELPNHSLKFVSIHNI